MSVSRAARYSQVARAAVRRDFLTHKPWSASRSRTSSPGPRAIKALQRRRRMIEKMIHKRLDPVADAFTEAHGHSDAAPTTAGIARSFLAPSAYAQSLSQT